MAPSTVTEQERAAFADDGFFLRRGAIPEAALEEARAAFDRLFAKAQRRGVTGLEDGAHFVLSGEAAAPRVERIVWAGGAEPTLLAIAEDPAILSPALALLGSQHCDQLLCQAHFKMPGDGVSFAWHQDIQHRDKGPGTWEDINGQGSYVQTILLLDRMGPGNGALKFLPRSTTGLARGARLSAAPFSYDEAMAPEEDPPGTVLIEGAPGDVLFFGPFAVHGSGPNEGTTPRRVLINGYAHPGANHRVYPGEGAGRRLPPRVNSLDLTVLVAYFLGVTVVSHWARPRRAHRDAYFLADRSLRWPLVAASIVATSISGVTFIGLPALVFAEGGDLRYLQFALAALIAKGVLGVALLPRYYAAGVDSPYEYITLKLGPRCGLAATGLFMIGAVLGQGVRVFAVALVLELLTGWSLGACIALIVGASALHTGHGGLRAVVWTDALQGLLFAGGGVFAVTLAVAGGAGSFEALFTAAGEAGKLRTLDFSTHPAASFTLWTGLLAMPFQNLAAYGGDQVNTQRMLACPSLAAARKALYTSLLGEGVTALFLLVGLALWAYYGTHALPPALASAVAENGDRIFPAFILDAIPSGVRGLLIAGVFAAAMSSLDSVLSALAQVSTAGDGDRSTRAVGLWALALGAFAWALGHGGGQLVPLAYQMTALSYPPLLGLLLLAAFAPRAWLRRPALGALGAIGLVVALLPLTTGPASSLAFPWLFPLGTVTFLALTVLPKRAT